MQHILDANVLINADRDYYPIEGIPQFWNWLVVQGRQGNIKILQETRDEITGDNVLNNWLKKPEVVEDLIVEHDSLSLVKRVIRLGYDLDALDEDHVQKLGRDPILIAYALHDVPNRRIVIDEVSKPSKTFANRKIPDVCRKLKVPCSNGFALYRALNFNTLQVHL